MKVYISVEGTTEGPLGFSTGLIKRALLMSSTWKATQAVMNQQGRQIHNSNRQLVQKGEL